MKNKAFEKLVVKSLNKGKYKHQDLAKRDVFSALQVYKGLAPQYDLFFNVETGDERMLLSVEGTIPILYKGKNYNIPVCFWLVHNYPESPPICFVKPTQDMQIKVSSNVGTNGLISLPYLEDWRQAESNLQDLIQILIIIFGQNPPVFSKGRGHHQAQSSLPHQNSTTSLPAMSSTTPMQSNSSQQLPLSRQTSLQESNSKTNEEDSNVDDLLSTEHLRASLISAAEQLVKSRLEEEVMKTRAELQSLHSINKELLDGQEQINEILQDIEKKEGEVTSHVDALTHKQTELEHTAGRLSDIKLEALDVDQIILVPDSLHRQILNAVGQDLAIDDAIYSLGRALHQEIIECDVYLKRVRDLSRQQFRNRVIIKKCYSNKKKCSN